MRYPLLKLKYFVALALRSFWRDLFVTASIALTLGAGIGASMTTFSIVHILAGDPIPTKSAVLFQPSVSLDGSDETDVQPKMAYQDAKAFTERSLSRESVILAQGLGPVETDDRRGGQGSSLLRFTTKDFFRMFDIPFASGGSWGQKEDVGGEHVAVLSKETAIHLFGSTLAVGKAIVVGGAVFRVVGVMDNWHPIPRFYDLSIGAYMHPEDVYIPIRSIGDLNSEVFVSFNCGDGADAGAIMSGRFDRLFHSECTWTTVWVELPSSSEKREYSDFLAGYLKEQRSVGRAAPRGRQSLRNLLDVLAQAKIVPGDVRVYTVLTFLFLALSLLSAAGALLGGFLQRSSEVQIRRALGASRSDILMQFLVESFLLGVVGGAVGLLMTLIGLSAVRSFPSLAAQVVRIDGTVLGVTLVLSLASGVIAGLVPAWRAARGEIGLELKLG